MNAWTRLSLGRLDPGTPKNLDQCPRNAMTRVAGVSLIVPEQTRVQALRRLCLPSGLNIFTHGAERALAQWQDPRFEELCLPNRNGARAQVNITEIQPC